MAFNGSGTFNRTNGDNTGSALWQQDETDGDNIESSRHDTHDQDLADGLTQCITKNGETTITQNIPFNSKRITGLGAATAATDAIQAGQVQNSALLWGGTSGGTASAQTITVTPSVTAYAAGQTFRFLPGNENTGATTLNVDSVGAKAIQRNGAALTGGELQTSDVTEVTYDGTQFQLTSPVNPAYCSVTVDSTSDAIAGVATNPFDEDNHTSFSSTANVTARGITFTQADGRFTVTSAGVYKIDFFTTLENTNAGSNLVTMSAVISAGAASYNDIAVDLTGSATTHKTPISLSIILPFTAGQYLEIKLAAALSGITTEPGMTLSMSRIA